MPPATLVDELAFVFTNRLPRIALTRLVGRLARVRNPLFVHAGIALWRIFGGLDLADARDSRFATLQDCFTRALRPGARPLDPAPEAVVSPCDGIVMACGRLDGVRALQAKGLHYSLAELLGSAELAERYRDGVFVTLRLTPWMYHRFHAPADGTVRRLTHIAGDTWNVNPPTVARIERLYCRNERAVLQFRLRDDDRELLLVPVAAVGVAGLRLHCTPERLGLGYGGPRVLECDHAVARGEELGGFELGSTVILIAPADFTAAPQLHAGAQLRMGERLLDAPTHVPTVD